MSTELPTPSVEKPRPRSQVVRSNRRQVLLFVTLTLILTVATVAWGGRTWLRNSETLVFAVGGADGEHQRFGIPQPGAAAPRDRRNRQDQGQGDEQQHLAAVAPDDLRTGPRLFHTRRWQFSAHGSYPHCNGDVAARPACADRPRRS